MGIKLGQKKKEETADFQQNKNALKGI